MASVRQTYLNDGGGTTSTYSNGKKTAPKPAVSTTSKSATSDYVSSYKPNTGTTTYKDASTGQNYTAPKDAYISSKATPQQVKTVYQQYGIIPSSTPNDDGGSRGGSYTGSGGETSLPASYTPSTATVGGRDVSTQQEDILQKIKDLLAEQEKKSDEAYKAQLEEQYAKNKELWRSNADQINYNRARAERMSRGLYGNESGANNTNMARIGAGWATSHNQNNRDLASNDATALSNYNTNLSNARQTLASGYSNFVLPVYTNRQNYLDELQYRRDANALDYDYRRFLATAGLM